MKILTILICLILCFSGCTPGTVRNQTPHSNNASPPKAQELLNQTAELKRLEAELERKQALFPFRPKKKFISASVQQPEYRSYMAAWVKHIESTGNRHYPAEARRHDLSGKVVVTVSIGRNGEHLETIINKSSGVQILDDAVVNIVKLASPFSSIPATDNIDMLFITRTWEFIAGSESEEPDITIPNEIVTDEKSGD